MHKSAALLTILSSTLGLAAPAKLHPIQTRPVSYLPPDIYDSAEPTFAGTPIVLAPPPPPPSSLTPGPGRYGMTYTPYTSDGLCKTLDAVQSDISRISSAGFSAVRLYATDCHAVHSVGSAALNSSLHMILGIHIPDEGVTSPTITTQVSAIADFIALSPDHLSLVDLVVVGNEAIFNDHATAPALAGLVADVRATVRQLGYLGPVTAAEPYGTFTVHAETLCPAVDVVAANLLPFFHADLHARDAGAFIAAELDQLEGLCEDVQADLEHAVVSRPSEEERAQLKKRGLMTESGTKPVLAMEVGWPSDGRPNGDAMPGVEQQRIALAGMSEAAGSRVVFSSFADDLWRDEGDFGVETHWGAIEVFQ